MAVYDEEKTKRGQPTAGAEQTEGKIAPNPAEQREIDDLERNYGSPTVEHPLGEAEGKTTRGPAGSGNFKFTGDEKAGRFAKAKGFLGKHRKKLLAALPATLIVPFFIFFMFLLGSLMLPHFVENVVAYQFAKLTRINRESTTAVIKEKEAIDSLPDNQYQQFKAKAATLKDNTIGKLDSYRPNKSIQNLEASGKLQYTYEKTKLGRQRLTGIIFTLPDNTQKTFKVNQATFTQRLNYPKYIGGKLTLYRQAGDALNEALRINDPNIPTVIRSQAVKNWLQARLGASLRGVIAKKFIGKSEAQASQELNKEIYAAAKDTSAADKAKSEKINEVSRTVVSETDKCLADPKCAQEIIDNPDQLPKQITDAVDNALQAESLKGLTEKIVSIANPIYGVAVPLCMIYDGSRISGSTIDAQSNEVQREAFFDLASASEQKWGGNRTASGNNEDDYNAVAAGALNRKHGDVAESIPLRRASGVNVNTTAEALSTQTAPLGNYSNEVTIFDVALRSVPAVASAMNNTADATCPTLTNFWVGIGLGIANLAAVFFSGGLAGGGEAAAEISTTQALRELASTMVAKLTTKEGLAQLGGATKKLTLDTAKFGAKIAGATFLAKLIVYQYAGTLHNGLAQGVAYANDVDNGANQVGNNVCRTIYYGRFLTNAEATESHINDQAEISRRNESKSTFERYFALSNPDSLATKAGTSVQSNLNHRTVASLVNQLGSFSPLKLAPSLFGSLSNKANAAANTDTADYGNVQCGWTNAEYALVDANATYSSLSENQFILEQSGKEDEIAQKYGPCFSEGMGKILEEGMIHRNDSTGDVKVDDALCSPRQLGPNNPEYGNLVFRWRIRQNRSATVNQLVGLTNIAEDSPAASNNPDTPPSSSGWAWPISKADYKGITQCWDAPSGRGRHAGLDIGVNNKPVLAAKSGTVVETGHDGAAGNYIIIKHPGTGGEPDLWSVYEHLATNSLKVRSNNSTKNVVVGQQIATSDSTGNVTGPHLHFGVAVAQTLGSYSNNSQTRDPLKYLPKDGRDTSPCS